MKLASNNWADRQFGARPAKARCGLDVFTEVRPGLAPWKRARPRRSWPERRSGSAGGAHVGAGSEASSARLGRACRLAAGSGPGRQARDLGPGTVELRDVVGGGSEIPASPPPVASRQRLLAMSTSEPASIRAPWWPITPRPFAEKTILESRRYASPCQCPSACSIVPRTRSIVAVRRALAGLDALGPTA